MRPLFLLMLSVAATTMIAAPAARAQSASDPTVYMVRYVEVMAGAQKQAAELITQLAGDSRKDAGLLRFDILQRNTPASHFATYEVWKDQASLDAHMAAAHIKKFLDAMQPLLIAPIDDRPCVQTDVGAARSAAPAGANYVITHVDVLPAGKDTTAGLLKALAQTARQDQDNLGFDVMAQTAHPNHFEVVEIWKSQAASDAHDKAPGTKQFRAALTPLNGALYDQRWYHPL